MSTLFRQWALVALLVSACGRASGPPLNPSPAPPEPADSAEAAQAREWARVTIHGPYGSFEMAVPAIRISAPDAGTALLIDSVALREVERRLLGRMSRVARAGAASLLRDTAATMMSTKDPAPEIRRGLLGAIPFAGNAIEPTPEGNARLKSVAALAAGLAGEIRIVAVASGTGAVNFDAALARARHVYLDLIAHQPRLAEREALVTVRTIATLPGAPLPTPVVEVYVSPQ